MVKQRWTVWLMMGGLCACDVESKQAESSGGLGAEDDGAEMDADGPGDATRDAGPGSRGAADAGPESRDTADGGAASAPEPECPKGVTVVLSDFFSTQIALSSLDGETLSESILSTGSSVTAGLAFALSGDVILPGAAPESGRVVLLDRFGTNVVTWLDPATGEVLGQLAVGTGFESNPQDYVEIGDGLALVSRAGHNPTPGMEDFDRGDDVLVVDTKRFEIESSIELPFDDELPPGPSALLRVGDHVLVNLERYSADYSETGEAMWAGISIAERDIAWIEPISRLRDCGRPVWSPDRSKLAVACSGRLEVDGSVSDIDESAVVLFDPTQQPPAELERYPAADIAGGPLQDELEFVSDGSLLLKTQSPWGGETNNRLLWFDLETEEVRELLAARRDSSGAGKGRVYGSLRCAPGCSDFCLVTDSDRGVLQRLRIRDGAPTGDPRALRVETAVGLLPIALTHR